MTSTDKVSDLRESIDDVVEAFDRDVGSEPVTINEDLKPAPSDLAVADGYHEPWTRRADESNLAWDRFKWFRDQGPSRTLKAIAEHFGLTYEVLNNNFSAKYAWRDRTAAYDVYMDRIYQLQRAEAVREMADRHAEQIIGALEALALPFKVIQERAVEEDGFMRVLRESSPKALIDLALKSGRIIPNLMTAERLARDAPTEITEVKGEVIHRHELDRNQVADIAAGLHAAGAFDRGGDADFEGPGSSGGGISLPGDQTIDVVEVVEEDTDTPDT